MKVMEMLKRLGIVLSTVFRRVNTKSKRKLYDCVVVCGYPAESDGTVSLIMKTRVEKAVKLILSGRAKYLILSGGAVANKFIEAEVMKKYAMELGIPETMILEEKAAKSTYHNMMYAKDIMEQQELKNCIVVTNGWHLRKADYYSRKFKLDYVMEKAEEPVNASISSTVWKYLSVNFQMYCMMFKGYY